MSSVPLEPVAVGCALAVAAFAVASIQAEGGEAEITAAAFGDIHDMSDGAKPIQKGGSHKDIVSGDTWYSTWAGDGTAYLIHDDGLGFNNIGGVFARHRLCRLEGAVSREETHNEGRNVALEAAASASSGAPSNAIGGCVDGRREWTAKGTVGEWIRLDWAPAAKTVHKVVLYDLAGARDQVVSGTLSFSDGSSIPVGKLQNDGQAGTVVTFPFRTTQWVKFVVSAVRPGTVAAGLAEMGVYAE